MKTLIIYSSQTGFTRKYAKWIAEAMGGNAMSLDDAKALTDKEFAIFDAIVYGGWAMAGKIVKSKWFLENAKEWKEKRLAIFCVGASPMGSPDIDAAMEKALSDEERKFIKLFYCPGGVDYSKMNTPSSLVLKTLAAVLKKSKDTSKQKQGEVLSNSYDISNKKYIEPIVEYLKEQ